MVHMLNHEPRLLYKITVNWTRYDTRVTVILVMVTRGTVMLQLFLKVQIMYPSDRFIFWCIHDLFVVK